MRRFLFAAALVLLSAMSVGAKEKVRVMSFNVRHIGEARDTGVLAWDCRKESVVRMLQDLKPDILTLQEAHKVQYEYILEHLPGYGHIEWILGRDSTSTGSRQCVIYRKDRFEFVDWGHVWLKEDPTTFGRGWDAANHRACTWCILRSRRTGKTYCQYNTHFDHKGWEARRQSAIMVANLIKELPEDTVTFLCGDFNMTFENVRMEPIKELMEHANDKARKADHSPTFNGWGLRELYLDHIFYRNADPRRFEVVNDYGKYGVMYLSDHNPVYCDFVVR